MLTRLFPSRRPGSPAVHLYGALVAQARAPAFYRELAVPDTLDGRFDMIVLHLFLVLRRLKAEGPSGQALSQELSEVFVRNMDQSLREMGVGDLGVGRRVKDMARALFGRIEAYETALAAGDAALQAALARNVYGAATPPAGAAAALADYVSQALAALDGRSLDQLQGGRLDLAPPLPGPAAAGGGPS